MKNQLKTVLLLGSLTALVMAMGAYAAPGQLWLFAALALAMGGQARSQNCARRAPPSTTPS